MVVPKCAMHLLHHYLVVSTFSDLMGVPKCAMVLVSSLRTIFLTLVGCEMFHAFQNAIVVDISQKKIIRVVELSQTCCKRSIKVLIR
jgi:hypothetical protein